MILCVDEDDANAMDKVGWPTGFEVSQRIVNEGDGSIVDFIFKTPDTDVFHDMLYIGEGELSNVSKIIEIDCDGREDDINMTEIIHMHKKRGLSPLRFHFIKIKSE